MFKADIKTVCRDLLNDNTREFSEKDTGIKDMYESLNIQEGDSVLISSRPSMGKTSLLLTMLNQKIDEGKKINMVLINEDPSDIVVRLVSMRTGIPISEISHKSNEVREQIEKELVELSNKNIFFNQGYFTDEEIIDYALTNNDMDIFVIENIDMILDSNIYDNVRTFDEIMKMYDYRREDKIVNTFHDSSDIAFDFTNTYLERLISKLKEIGNKEGFSLICTIKHSRITDYRSGHEPELEDLRKYARIDQVADIILFPFRWDFYGMDEDEFELNQASIFIPKYKRGTLNGFFVTWNPETAEFVDWKASYEDMFGLDDQLEFELLDEDVPI